MSINMKKKITKPKATDGAIPHEEVFASTSPTTGSVNLESSIPKISKLELDFNNDGLNKMASKINEIIDAL